MHRISSPHFERRMPCLLRPLRPPNSAAQMRVPHQSAGTAPHSRLFTHNSQLLLVAGRLVSRPQLPFLHHSTAASLGNKTTHPSSRGLVQRFLSTERKKRWKDRLKWQLRFHSYFWPGLLLVWALLAGVEQTKLEHDYPTPREWTFWSRWDLRTAMDEEFDEERVTRGLVDWGRAGVYYSMLLERLEDEKLDGGRLMRQGDGGILVDGLGETGWDVSMKSEEWRMGYWQGLMGCGRVSERLEGMVKKKGRKGGRLIEKECVVGAANPRPKPMPWGMGDPWREDEVEDAFPSPETFYLRVLTTKGFTSVQKVEAALAYADWCDFKGMSGTAEGVLEWGMDLAVAGLEATGKNARDVIDKKTGVVDSKRVGDVSSNLLKVCTSMGVHFAQQGDVKRALPIFLSVLKARKELPAQPLYTQRTSGTEDKKKSSKQAGLWVYLYAVRDWLVEAPYPQHPLSGDETPYHSLKEACEEVGLMTYIGEILYATSSKEKGLGWTRDAVDAAEAVMWVMKEEQREDGRETCEQCLKTGLENWRSMARALAKEAESKEKDILAKSKDQKWYDFSRPEKQREHAKQEIKKWKDEEVQIELRREKTVPLVTPLRPVKMGWFSV